MLEYEHKVILTPEEYRCIFEHLFFDSLSDGDIDYANHVSGFNTSETNPLTHTEKRIPWFSIYLCAYDTKHPDEKVLKKYTPYGYDNPNDNIIDKFISDE